MDYKIDKNLISKRTLSDQIYDVLYKLITEGEIKPGDELTERELAKNFNVSRTPIREVFNRLRGEGLIEGNNYARVTVRKITKEDIEEVFELRCLIEIYFVKDIIKNCTQSNIEEFEKILEKTYRAIQNDDMEKVIIYNTLFHEALSNTSNKKRAAQLLGNFRNTILMYRKRGIQNKDFAMEIYNSHKNLFEAIKQKDHEKAIRIIEEHTQESLEATLMGLKKLI